jgi:hypothetical protein
MIRRILIVFGALLPQLVFSQNSIFLGPTVASVSGTGFSGFGNIGFAFGFSHKRDENSGFRISPQFITKGARNNASASNNLNTQRWNRGYLECPVSYSWKPTSWIELHGGACAGILVYQYDWNSIDGRSSPSFPFKRWELSLQAGLIFHTASAYSFEFRSSISALPVRNAAFVVNKGNPFEYGYYNQVLQIAIHRRFSAD